MSGLHTLRPFPSRDDGDDPPTADWREDLIDRIKQGLGVADLTDESRGEGRLTVHIKLTFGPISHTTTIHEESREQGWESGDDLVFDQTLQKVAIQVDEAFREVPYDPATMSVELGAYLSYHKKDSYGHGVSGGGYPLLETSYKRVNTDIADKTMRDILAATYQTFLDRPVDSDVQNSLNDNLLDALEGVVESENKRFEKNREDVIYDEKYRS